MSRTTRDLIDCAREPQNDAQAQPTGSDLERIVALALAAARDARPQSTTAPKRLGGRALFMRRTAPVGHPGPRSVDEQAQKLSGRALMFARQKNGGRPLGAPEAATTVGGSR
jgi:hypothetical protein